MEVSFTLADFVAIDRRHARHFASLPVDASGVALPVRDALDSDPGPQTAQAPSVYLVDRDDVLREVLVDEKLVRETRRCRDFWRGLQQLGSVASPAVTAASDAPAETVASPAPAAAPVDTALQAASECRARNAQQNEKDVERLGNLAAAAANAGDVAKAMVYADSINRIQSAGCSQ